MQSLGYSFAVSAVAKPVSVHPAVNKYASIIVDAQTLEILHARQIDGLRYPASLTKMMTLYLVFDALEQGELTLDERLPVSAHAARAAPVKLNLKEGEYITVKQAITALAVMSGNDVAVVLAERLAGSEEAFARLMTAKARSLGMQKTLFRNANGLPNPAQLTTARDMAKLASAHLQNHPEYYGFFSTKMFHWKGRAYGNHNTLLFSVRGVDGFKTGYTRASGYNLVISAQRDGHRIIAVVLGGASGRTRDRHMADLVERGFDVIRQNDRLKSKSYALNADIKPVKRVYKRVENDEQIHVVTLRGAHGNPLKTVRVVESRNMIIPASVPTKNWAVQVGVYADERRARQAALSVMAEGVLGLTKAKPITEKFIKSGHILYRARIAGLGFAQADTVCKALKKSGQSCLMVAP